ncbi:MAG: hypothetical protein M1501_02890 [Candidatus Omnitrophica bacterium]|nr:hypothetical protein [Candidatus Omnitrophota bacterium]
MAEKGLGGFIFHGRDGLRSKYLENEWEQGLRFAIEEADLLGLHIWLYDENHYPSGIAGSKVFEKYPNRFMKSLAADRELIIEPGCNINITISENIRYVLCCPVGDKDTVPLQDILPLTKERKLKWTNSGCEPVRILVLREDNYHPGSGNLFEYYPDYLDPEVSKEFINLTHEWYSKKFSCYYSRLIKGIFTDNACANFGHIRRAIPWSRRLAQRFKKKTGCDIRDVLPGLFYRVRGYRENRLLFWRFLNDEFLNSYVTAILRHCNKSGIYSTGHYCLEDGLSEHIRQIGDYFQVMKNQSLNAVDQLGPSLKGGPLFGNFHGENVTASIKNTVSAAALYGSPRVMCESFGLASGWDFDLQELRRLSGYLSALGVDLFVPHGFYYSIAGSRKYECIPDHFHNPMWKYYRKWTDWISRLCWLSAGSDSLAEVAVLHPTTTLQAYMELGAQHSGKSDSSDHGEVCEKVDSIFKNVVETLIKNHINCEILPEEALQRSKLEKAILKVPTQRSRPWRIKVLILPYTKVLEQKTIDVILAFIRNGGKVFCVGQSPEIGYDIKSRKLIPLTEYTLSELSAKCIVLSSTDSQQDYNDILSCRVKDEVIQPFIVKENNGKLISRVWEKAGCRFYLLHNCTNKMINNISLTFYDKNEPVLFNLDKPQFMKTDGIRYSDWFYCKVSLPPANTLLWVTGSNIKSDSGIIRLSIKPIHSMEIKTPWIFSTATPNLLPLRNGNIVYEEEKYRCDFKFFVKGHISNIILLIDVEMTRAELICNTYNSNLSIVLNGKSISSPRPGRLLDTWIFETDMSSAIKSGENNLRIQHGSAYLVQGRMWNPYLAGNFCIIENTGKFILSAPSDHLLTGDCTSQGYPFYAGEYCYLQTLRLPGECMGRTVWLDLGEVFNAAEVFVNGKSLGRRILPPWKYKLPELTKKGTFNLEIRIINTPQNLYGKKRVKSGLLGPVRFLW